jgi:ParB-like chromosome segregation protein Spo0J
MQEKPIISYLKFSSKNVGRLYPVLIDKQGNVIDGMHRLKADKNWPKIKLENVETEEQRLITRLISM